MASLARRIAPAAALGGIAVAVVGLLDPALAGAPRAEASPQGASTSDAGDPAGDQTTSNPCDSAETVTGPQSMTPWGPVQVQATVADGTLCQVQAVAWPTDQHSQRINAYAIPQLDAIAAQRGVTFDNISGATYTSNAYWDSLQQLLDSL